MMRIIRTVCPKDCYDTCFLKAYVENNELVKTEGDPENPLTAGFTCPRGVSYPRRINANRVLYPHRRAEPKPTARFERITWDEALNMITVKIREAIEECGPRSILHVEYAGNMGLLTYRYPLRLWNALGATSTDHSICSRSGHEALSLHYGLSYGLQPEDLLGARLIVFWGFNAAVSSPHMWRLAWKARKRGAVIAAVDPRRSETARNADLWLSPKPGTDVALAYGVARYLILGGYVDEDFIEKYTYGYERFREEALKWTPERVRKTTGVSKEKLEELAELYGERKPSATMIGFGMQKSLAGAEAVRAVSLIPALLGIHRGFYYSNSMGWLVNDAYLTGEALARRRHKVISQVRLAEELERGNYRIIFIWNINPVVTIPEATRLAKALAREDVFVVVHETHWTETCSYADIVLPAPTFLEKDDVILSYSHRYVRLARKAVEPMGESRSEAWLAIELARRLGISEAWVYEDPWEALGKALRGAFENGSFEDLLAGKTLKLKSRPRDKYQTPTGKIEFYSIIAEQKGYSPLPVQLELQPPEGYFVLLNSATPRYVHTQFREVYGPQPAIVKINPADAEALGVEDGDTVTLYNEHGEVKVKAVVTDEVPPGVLWSPRQLIGLDGQPQNAITSSRTQELGGGSTFNSTLVKVKK